MPTIKVALRVRPVSQRELNENYPVVIAVDSNSAFITDIRVPERSSADSRPRFRQFDFDHAFWFRRSTPSQTNSPFSHEEEKEELHQSQQFRYCHKGSTISQSQSYSSSSISNTNSFAATQSEVYEKMGPCLEKAILAGYNACLLAYGQSGSGKTYTMIGSREDFGIIPRFCQRLWDKLQVTHPPSQATGKPSFRLEVSFVEIYREKVRDLLNPDKVLKLREHPQLGPHVQGLTRVEVTGETALLDLLWEGERRRALGNTTSNRCSSRSHAIWTLYLTVFTYPSAPSSSQQPTTTPDSHDNENSSSSNEESHNSSGSNSGGYSCGGSVGGIKSKEYKDNGNGNYPGRNAGREDRMKKIITSQVHLVDLAGSEKANCTAAKSLLVEGADINKSLVALGNVISALAEKSQYIPYRDSTLTWLLKDSIGGNASTSIIITASPSSHCHAQTLNSFRFAQRARLVENTPKVNTAPAGGGGHYSGGSGPYGFLSVMSVMELKKDISRLARLIKSAHSNGGILRGLVPRSGWTRLIHAIEGIGRVEKEQVSVHQRDRAFSEDTAANTSSVRDTTPSTSTEDGPSGEPSTSSSHPPSSSASSATTLTQAKSLNDVMVQADMERKSRLHNLRRRASRQSESALPTTSSSAAASAAGPHSPTKIVGTEVFIPTSNSYKCLTWQQEETHPVPKPNLNSSSNSSLASVSSEESGNDLNSSNPQIHHMKYMLKVQYPVTNNLDHAARISEKIHGVITDEYYQQKTEVIPEEVDDSSIGFGSTGPLVHDKIPTLVHAQDLNEEEEMCEGVNEGKEGGDEPLSLQSVFVGQFAKESKEYLFPEKCKEFASAITPPPKGLTPFESSDENEFYEPEELPQETPYRAIYPQISKSLQRTLSREQNSGGFDETCCYFTAVESALSQVPFLGTLSSSSSYESIITPEKVRPVNLVKGFSETKDIEEDSMEEFTIENEVFQEDYEPPVANVCLAAGQPMEFAVPSEEILVAEPNSLDNTLRFNPINGVSDSKFRNYFAKELHQMDRMGKQIKSLLQMTQRCNVVKPYLDEISNLQNSDHSRPDPYLDEHIDTCSGWNVDIELAKVHQEIHQLNKVLKTGLGSDGMASSSNHNHHHHRSKMNSIPTNLMSSTSTIHNNDAMMTATSDDGGDDDSSSFGRINNSNSYLNSLSFARTRHIPLLGNKASAADFSSDSSSLARKSSSILLAEISQPNFNFSAVSGIGSSSSSSNSNNSLPSVANTTTSSKDVHYYMPNISSSTSLPEGKVPLYKSRSNTREASETTTNDFSKISHYSSTFRPLNIENFAATSSKSMDAFYSNSSANSSKPAPSAIMSSIWSCPSSTKSSTFSTNITNSSSSTNSNTNTHTSSSEGSRSNSLNYYNNSCIQKDEFNPHNNSLFTADVMNVGVGRLSLSSSSSEPKQFNQQQKQQSSNFGGTNARKSESCANFQRSHHHHQQCHNSFQQKNKCTAFNSEEIRSHGQLYENNSSRRAADAGKAGESSNTNSEKEFQSLMLPIRKEAWDLYTKSGDSLNSMHPLSYRNQVVEGEPYLGENTSGSVANKIMSSSHSCPPARAHCGGGGGAGGKAKLSNSSASCRSRGSQGSTLAKKYSLNVAKLPSSTHGTPYQQNAQNQHHHHHHAAAVSSLRRQTTHSSSDGENSNHDYYQRHQSVHSSGTS